MIRFHLLFLFIALLGACPGRTQEKSVIIRIIQDEPVTLSEFQTNLKLEKKSFRFQVFLKNVDGVYVFASVRDSVYRFTENSPIRDFSYLKLLELRDEDIFNSNKELNISETGWSYWFYNDTAEWHPYNRRVIKLDSNNVCTKMIRQLYNVNEAQTVKLRDVNTPLYLIFLAVAEYDKNGKPVKELLRRKVKIEWIND